MSKIEERINAKGIIIPDAPSAQGNYVGAKVAGNLVFCSGALPMLNGRLLYTGQAGSERMVEEAQDAAKFAAINLLSSLKGVCNGDLDKIKSVVKLNVFVNSAPDFNQQHVVANGASDLIVAAFGESGRHARAAIGVAQLPLGATVEVEGIFEI